MMLDADVVAASPSSVYRVLRKTGLLDRWNAKPTQLASAAACFEAERCRRRTRR